jgi:hypothetical protein
MRRLAVGSLVLLGAWLAAFFLTFNGLFSDGPRSLAGPERLLSFALIAAAHAGLAALGARFGGGRWAAWASLVAAPSVAIALLYAARESTVLGLAILCAVVAAGASALGAWLARRVRGSRMG